MDVRVRLPTPRIHLVILSVLAMLVVNVGMRALQPFVIALVLKALRQVKPDSGSHQGSAMANGEPTGSLKSARDAAAPTKGASKKYAPVRDVTM